MCFPHIEGLLDRHNYYTEHECIDLYTLLNEENGLLPNDNFTLHFEVSN